MYQIILKTLINDVNRHVHFSEILRFSRKFWGFLLQLSIFCIFCLVDRKEQIEKAEEKERLEKEKEEKLKEAENKSDQEKTEDEVKAESTKEKHDDTIHDDVIGNLDDSSEQV